MKLESELKVTRETLERKEADMQMRVKEYSLMFDASSDGLWYMHYPKDGNVKSDTAFMWSDKFRHILGYENTNDFPNILDSWAGKLHPDDLNPTFKMFSDCLADKSGNTKYNPVYRLKMKDGSYRWFRADGAVLRDAQGNPLIIAGFAY